MKYRKKPVIIEAVQWDGNNTDEILSFGEGNCTYEPMISGRNLIVVNTLESNEEVQTRHAAEKGDWIIKGIEREQEYIEIAKCRVDAVKIENDLF